MRRIMTILLTITFLISAGTSAYASDASENLNDAEKILEQMENIGFWEKEGASVARNATVLEYTRYDGEKTEVEISENAGNQVVTFRSEGKVNTIIVTPEGEYYCDEVAEENKISGSMTTTFAEAPRVTTETWMTNTVPYDNGPYTFNKGMTKHINIDLNREIGSYALDALIFILVPEVPMLKYFEKGMSMIGNFDDFATIIDALQGELPFSECVYVQEKYYNGDSDTSGRPIEYCYQVWTRVAKTSSFSSFIENIDGVDVQISYAKQLIYA